jgi:hypothetical protein
MVAAEPAAHRSLFERLGEPDCITQPDGALRVATPRGAIVVMTPHSFAARFPGSAIDHAPSSPHFAGYRVAVEDVSRAARCVADSGLRHGRASGRVWVKPADGFGTVIEFA